MAISQAGSLMTLILILLILNSVKKSHEHPLGQDDWDDQEEHHEHLTEGDDDSSLDDSGSPETKKPVVHQEIHYHYAPQFDQSQKTQTISDSVYQHKEIQMQQPQEDPREEEQTVEEKDQSTACPRCGDGMQYLANKDDHYCWKCEQFQNDMGEGG